MRQFLTIYLFFCCFCIISAEAQVTADFSINYPTPVCNPAVISFTNLSTGQAHLKYEWNFGVNPGVNSILENPSTTYGDCGTFTVTLTVTDGLNQKSVKTQQLMVNCKPFADFTVSSTAGCYPMTVQFTSTSIPGSGNLSNYVWDFGDGSGGTGANPSHTYTTAGCKTVTLVATNSKGCSDDTTRVKTVCVYDHAKIDFTATPAASCGAPLTTSYSPSVTGGASPYTFSWDFSGGKPATSASPNPSVTYSTPGSFNTKIYVTDANGCKDTIVKNKYINVGNNIADLSIDKVKGCTPLTVAVSGIESGGAQGWLWTATSSAGIDSIDTQNATFTFIQPGTYQVCLTIDYGAGCTAQKCTTVTVSAVPKAIFGITGNAGICAPPLNVVFHDSSVGNNLTYAWSFAGGNPATDTSKNPSVNYSSCGSYSVTLTVTNAGGCSDTKTATNIINIDCPVASFESSPKTGCAPLPVQFNSSASTGNPKQWKWNFGDTADPNEVQSTLQNPNHFYTQPGCYTVRLITINDQGCTDTITSVNEVCVGAVPDIKFKASTDETCARMPVTFTNQSSNVNTQTTYAWNFSRRNSYNILSTDENPVYTYGDTGRMDVTLIVCNYGCCDTLTIDKMITVYPPVAIFNITRDCSSPYSMLLNGTPSLGADSYSWDLTGGTPSSSTDSIVTVSYPSSDSYTIKLTVTNARTGCTYTMQKKVQTRKVKADFAVVTAAGCKPFSACLKNNSTDAVSYEWSVIDSAGTTVSASTQEEYCPVLQTPGSYIVQLIATDMNGCKDTMTKKDFITVFGTNVNFTVTPASGCRPLNAQFQDASASASSYAVDWKWTFGDPFSGNLNSSTDTNPSHTYDKAGNYAVTLTIIDNNGCIDSVKKTGIVKVNEPALRFAVDSVSCLGNPACFQNNSTGKSLSYQWSFGDGGTSTQATPCHTYATTGYYTVTLSATDANGCSASLTDSAAIKVVSPPTADLVADTTHTSCPPLAVNFTNLSTGINNKATYKWDFGDGSTSAVKNPFHYYNTAGIFDVTLITTNEFGCSDTVVFKKYIDISGPKGTATGTPTSGCNPLDVCFHAVTINTQGYAWNFGDGTVVSNNIDTVCYSYTRPGKFFPQVILSDGLGCSVAVSLGTITIGSPGVKFVMSEDSVCSNGNIQFTDSSYSSIPIVSWAWNFGDPNSGTNNISSQQNPSRFFSSPGIYPVNLTIETTFGCTGFYSDTVYVIAPPAALFSGNKTSICPGDSVFITDNSQTSGTSAWNWNFGDAASGTLNSSTEKNPAHVFNIPGDYLITLILKNGGGCSDTSTGTIHVNQNPVAVAGNDIAVCFGSGKTITATGGVNYLWSPSAGLNNDSTDSPMASPDTTTVYQVLVTDGNGCTATDEMVVTVNYLPVVSAGKDTMICPATETALSATGAVSYVWTPVTGLDNPSVSNPFAKPGVTTSYTVTGTDINGCNNTDSVIISLAPMPVANAGTDTAVCEGVSVQLNGLGGADYMWSPSTVTNTTTSNPVANPVVTTTYTLTVVDANKCTANDNIVIVVHPSPNVDAGKDVQICSGNSGILQASGADNYLWYPTYYLNTNNIANPVTTPDSTIKYYLQGTDMYGCASVDSVTVFVNHPVVAKVGPGASICLGEVIHLSASGGMQYHWTPESGLDNPYIANPVSSPQFTTEYKVVISDGICSIDSATVTVIVNPLAICDAGNDKNTSAGSVITLNASAGLGSYSWSPAVGLSCTDCLNPTVTASHDTTYVLTVITPAGCRTEDSVRIRVACVDDVIFLPNAFSPNNDNKNATFRVRSYGLKSINYLRIFNRWGQLIFESNDIDKGWDGKINGVNAAPGVYVYDMEGVCSSGEKIQKQGNVTLIR